MKNKIYKETKISAGIKYIVCGTKRDGLVAVHEKGILSLFVAVASGFPVNNSGFLAERPEMDRP